MKAVITFIILLVTTLLYSQYNPEFSSTTDTIILETKKAKGPGMFPLGASDPFFRDTSEFNSSLIYPSTLTDIKRTNMVSNFRASNFGELEFLTGKSRDVEVFIVDQNNNKDLTDDSIRTIQNYEWFSAKNSIRCIIDLPVNDTFLVDTAWIQIGKSNGWLLRARHEHLVMEFQLDDIRYKLGAIDPVLQSTFSYGLNPQIAIIEENDITKDTLLEADLLKKGQFLKLSDQYYRFDSISTYGKYVWLVKEENFENQIGTQIGMIAPDFTATALTGELLTSDSLHDKPLLIANTCACGGDIEGAGAYNTVSKSFKDKLNTIRLDSNFRDKSIRSQVDTENKENNDIYNKYRNAYCSRTAILISPTNRIVDKFPITEWENHLPKYLSSDSKE